jgi:hypothetical protein
MVDKFDITNKAKGHPEVAGDLPPFGRCLRLLRKLRLNLYVASFSPRHNQ